MSETQSVVDLMVDEACRRQHKAKLEEELSIRTRHVTDGDQKLKIIIETIGDCVDFELMGDEWLQVYHELIAVAACRGLYLEE